MFFDARCHCEVVLAHLAAGHGKQTLVTLSLSFVRAALRCSCKHKRQVRQQLPSLPVGEGESPGSLILLLQQQCLPRRMLSSPSPQTDPFHIAKRHPSNGLRCISRDNELVNF